ncbi:MAG: hypothetical protein ACREAK_06290, partial [Nitrosarchaeum sp.]
MKKLSNLFSLLLIVTLFGCEKDNETNQLNQKEIGKYRVKEYTFKEAIERPKFNKSFNIVEERLNKSKAHNKSNTPERDNDFVIDSTT